ncbi:MAG: hypothetical protein ABSB01_26200 [Streptosporangiaceae bacterium]
MRAETFEEALSRVSRRVAVLARQAAAELRAERRCGSPGRQAEPRARWARRSAQREPDGRRRRSSSCCRSYRPLAQD